MQLHLGGEHLAQLRLQIRHVRIAGGRPGDGITLPLGPFALGARWPWPTARTVDLLPGGSGCGLSQVFSDRRGFFDRLVRLAYFGLVTANTSASLTDC